MLLICFKAQTQPSWHAPRALDALNSSADEFSPTWNPYDSCLVFCSTRASRALCYKASSDLHNVLPLQLVSLPTHNQYTYLCYSLAGEKFFSTFRMSERQPVMNIMNSLLSNGIWSDAVFVESLVSESFSSHASITPNGLSLVFASDRSGGEGKCDLWLSTKSGSNWNAPINIGTTINSSGNEITPFFASDDSLYFASDALGGRGGYELFLSIRLAGEWQAPIPLTEFNTAFDESDFAILPNGDAVFASNRPGGKGGLDLYLSRANSKN